MENHQTSFTRIDRREQRAILEALIFSADEPVSDEFIARILTPNPEKAAREEISALAAFIRELVEEINYELEESPRPYRIVDYAGGWQFATKSEYGFYLQNFIKAKAKKRLSQAALETLAIVAYRGNATKPEIEQIRGVASSEVVNTLLDKGFLEIAGRRETLGRPLAYGVTARFMKAFGLRSLDDLPKLSEIEDLAEMSNIDAETTLTLDLTKPREIPEDILKISDSYSIAEEGDADQPGQTGRDTVDAEEGGAHENAGETPTDDNGIERT